MHIFPGVLHGYVMPGISKAFDQVTRDFSMGHALAILNGFRGVDIQQSSMRGARFNASPRVVFLTREPEAILKAPSGRHRRR